MKDPILNYLEAECLKQAQARKHLNTPLPDNVKRINKLSLNSIKFIKKVQKELGYNVEN
jgi:hypothetical protein